MPVVSGPSKLHSSGACGLRSPPSCALSLMPRMCAWRLSELPTLPSSSDVGSMSPTPLGEHRAARWRGDWTCCCRRIPQSAPEGLFLFEKILLLNPAAPYKEGPVLSHNPPLQLHRELSWSVPYTAQLSTLPSPCPQSPCVYHFVLIPLPATSSNQVSLSAAQALFCRGGSR